MTWDPINPAPPDTSTFMQEPFLHLPGGLSYFPKGPAYFPKGPAYLPEGSSYFPEGPAVFRNSKSFGKTSLKEIKERSTVIRSTFSGTVFSVIYRILVRSITTTRGS